MIILLTLGLLIGFYARTLLDLVRKIYVAVKDNTKPYVTPGLIKPVDEYRPSNPQSAIVEPLSPQALEARYNEKTERLARGQERI